MSHKGHAIIMLVSAKLFVKSDQTPDLESKVVLGYMIAKQDACSFYFLSEKKTHHICNNVGALSWLMTIALQKNWILFLIKWKLQGKVWDKRFSATTCLFKFTLVPDWNNRVEKKCLMKCLVSLGTLGEFWKHSPHQMTGFQIDCHVYLPVKEFIILLLFHAWETIECNHHSWQQEKIQHWNRLTTYQPRWLALACCSLLRSNKFKGKAINEF